MIHGSENKDYAIDQHQRGRQRYAINDTVKLVDQERSEFVITGRTKHFPKPGRRTPECRQYEQDPSRMVCDDLTFPFGIYGSVHSYGSFFAHQWYVATDDKSRCRETCATASILN